MGASFKFELATAVRTREECILRSTEIHYKRVVPGEKFGLETCNSKPETRGLIKQTFDVIILGGGAAGLMCAIEAGKRGRRVAVLEHADRIGKKILISGGGRCNFTNLYCQPENFLSENPHFCKSALGPIHASRFHPTRREARNFLPREKAGSTLLRWLGAGDRGNA